MDDFPDTDPPSLEARPAEVLQKLVYDSGVLEPKDILNLALTSTVLKKAVLGDDYARRRAMTTAPLEYLVGKRAWLSIRTGIMYDSFDPQEALTAMVKVRPDATIPRDSQHWHAATRRAIVSGADPKATLEVVSTAGFDVVPGMMEALLATEAKGREQEDQALFASVVRHVFSVEIRRWYRTDHAELRAWTGAWLLIMLSRGFSPVYQSLIISIFFDNAELVRAHAQFPDLFVAPPAKTFPRPLIYAVMHASADVVYIVAGVPTIDADATYNPKQETALHRFVEQTRARTRYTTEEEEGLAELLLSIVDPYIKNTMERTALELAAVVGSAAFVRAWIDARLQADAESFAQLLVSLSSRSRNVHSVFAVFEALVANDLLDTSAVVMAESRDEGTFMEFVLFNASPDVVFSVLSTPGVDIPETFPSPRIVFGPRRRMKLSENEGAYEAAKRKLSERPAPEAAP